MNEEYIKSTKEWVRCQDRVCYECGTRLYCTDSINCLKEFCTTECQDQYAGVDNNSKD